MGRREYIISIIKKDLYRMAIQEYGAEKKIILWHIKDKLAYAGKRASW